MTSFFRRPEKPYFEEVVNLCSFVGLTNFSLHFLRSIAAGWTAIMIQLCRSTSKRLTTTQQEHKRSICRRRPHKCVETWRSGWLTKPMVGLRGNVDHRFLKNTTNWLDGEGGEGVIVKSPIPPIIQESYSQVTNTKTNMEANKDKTEYLT